jgi:hypothetical protein
MARAAAVVLTLAGVVLAGCGDEDAASKPPSTSTQLAIGEVHDGGPVQVSVTNLRRFTTSSTAKPAPGAPAFAVDLVVRNRGSKAVSSVRMSVESAVAGAPAAEVVDEENRVDGGMAATEISPGNEETISFGFTAQQTGPLLVTVRGAEKVPVTFSGVVNENGR